MLALVLAAVGNTPYNIVLVVHILVALVAFAPAFVHPFLVAQSKSLGEESRRGLITLMAGNGRRIYAPAVILTGLLGFALSGMSEGVYALSQTWLLASIVIWIAMNGILHAVLLPAERAVGAGDDGAQQRVDLGGAVLTLLLVIMLVLMVFKPGL
jgi:uncharacterized membrane protein